MLFPFAASFRAVAKSFLEANTRFVDSPSVSSASPSLSQYKRFISVSSDVRAACLSCPYRTRDGRRWRGRSTHCGALALARARGGRAHDLVLPSYSCCCHPPFRTAILIHLWSCFLSFSGGGCSRLCGPVPAKGGQPDDEDSVWDAAEGPSLRGRPLCGPCTYASPSVDLVAARPSSRLLD